MMKHLSPYWILVPLVLALTAGCGLTTEPVADEIPAEAAAPSEAPSTGGIAGLTPDPAVNPEILRASRTPIAYRDEDRSGDSSHSDALKQAIADAKAAEGPRDVDLGGPARAFNGIAAGESGVVREARINEARRSASKMGLILMRKIVVPEYPTRRPVRSRSDADRKPAPASGPSPAPGPTKLR